MSSLSPELPRYTTVPTRTDVALDKRLTRPSLVVYLELLARGAWQATIPIRTRCLAHTLDIDPSTARRALSLLAACGYVVDHRAGHVHLVSVPGGAREAEGGNG